MANQTIPINCMPNTYWSVKEPGFLKAGEIFIIVNGIESKQRYWVSWKEDKTKWETCIETIRLLAGFINSFKSKAITLTKYELEQLKSEEFSNILLMVGGNVKVTSRFGHLVVSTDYGGGILFEPPIYVNGVRFRRWNSKIDFQTGDVDFCGSNGGIKEIAYKLSENKLFLLKKIYRAYLLTHLEWITFSLSLMAHFDEKELKMAQDRGFIIIQ